MALKKPTDLFGVQKVSQIVEEIDRFETLQETHELTGGTPGGNFSVSFSASMIDEIFKNLQARIEKKHETDIQGVYEELAKCKKLVNTSQLKIEGRVGVLKKELYERIDEHIVRAQQTIQEMYQTEIRQIKKLSNDIQLVEKYIASHSNKIIELRAQINEELQKRPVAIDRIETKIDLVAESYQHLSENLNEGLLNEPVTADAISNTEFVTPDQLKDHYRLFLNRIEEQLSTLGGGGEVNLKYLDDVVGISTNAAEYDGKFLRYNHSLGKFEFISNGPWADSLVLDPAIPGPPSWFGKIRVGIHTNIPVAIGTTIISQSGPGYSGYNPLTVSGGGAAASGVGIDTCNKFVFTNQGDLGLGTTNPTHFNIWNTFTLDGDKRSLSGAIGGGDIVMKAEGRQFLDLYAYQLGTGYAGVGFSSSIIAAFSRPFDITGYSGIASAGYATSMRVDGFNIGLSTYNPRKTHPAQKYGLDVQDSDLYVGIGNTRGVVLTSPNGTAYRIVVDDSGNITTSAV